MDVIWRFGTLQEQPRTGGSHPIKGLRKQEDNGDTFAFANKFYHQRTAKLPLIDEGRENNSNQFTSPTKTIKLRLDYSNAHHYLYEVQSSSITTRSTATTFKRKEQRTGLRQHQEIQTKSDKGKWQHRTHWNTFKPCSHCSGGDRKEFSSCSMRNRENTIESCRTRRESNEQVNQETSSLDGSKYNPMHLKVYQQS